MSNDMMKIGGIGAIIGMLAVIEEIVAIIMLWVSPIDYFFAGAHMDFGGGIAWAVGLALISVGAFGLWKHYKKSFPLVIGIMGIATMALGLVASILLWLDGMAITSISATFGWGFPLLNLIGVAGIVWLVLTGVLFILLGIALIKLKESTGVRNVTMFAGVLALIIGATYCAVIPFGYLATQSLALITMILLAYVFFKAK